MKNLELFELHFPLERPHCGMPMGNGQLGVLVWGKDKLCLTVNRSDYWDHRYGESYLGPRYKKLVEAHDPHDVEPVNNLIIRKDLPFERWRSTRLSCGRFEFSLRNDAKPQTAVLDYGSGAVRVDCDNSLSIKFSLGLKQDILLIEDPESLIKKVNFVSTWEYVGDALKSVGLSEPEKIQEPGICGEIQSVPEDPSLAALCFAAKNGFAVTLQRGADNRAAFEQAKSVFESCDFRAIKQHAESWWKKYWQRTAAVSIPDEFLNVFYKFAFYKFACATHPYGYACGLQGPWHEEYQLPRWSGDYHFNVNIQQIYTAAFASGNSEHLLPLFDMLESKLFQKTMRDNARNMFGIDDGLLMTHAVDDRGRQCGWISVGSTLDFACGGWTALLYWLYYKHTLDEAFLKKRALPFIRGIMRVFEETLEERNGKLSIPLSISAEYGCTFKVKKDGRYVNQNSGRDPSYQLACMHMLADILLEACEVVREKPRDIWLDIKQRLPQYTLAGEPDAPHIAIWEDQDLDVCHRHHSHLACIYPFDTLGSPNAEQQEILDNSVEHWIQRGMGQWSEWCFPWAAIIQTRMGLRESPAILLNIWKEIFINEGMSTVYLPRIQGLTAHRRAQALKPREINEVMQLDGMMGAGAAILEMLAHQQGDTVHLFRGIPDKWRDVEFKNIRLPGAFSISAVRANGQLKSVKVKSVNGGSLRIKLPGRETQTFDFDAGQEQELTDTVKNKQIEA